MTSKILLFGGHVTKSMSTAYTLKWCHLSLVETDNQHSYAACRHVLTDILDVIAPTDFDCEMFRYMCKCVTKRSAHLVSAGLISVLRRLSPAPVTVVAVGGCVFETHPEYYAMVGRKVEQLADHESSMSVQLRMTDHEHGAPLVAKILANMPSNSQKTRPDGINWP